MTALYSRLRDHWGLPWRGFLAEMGYFEMKMPKFKEYSRLACGIF